MPREQLPPYARNVARYILSHIDRQLIFKVLGGHGSGGPGSMLWPHSNSHEDGGADEIDVDSLSGLLGDPQTPLPHNASHQSGGSDVLAAFAGDAGAGGAVGYVPAPAAGDGAAGKVLGATGGWVAASGGDANAIHVNASSEISGLTEKASPVSGDLLIIEDSTSSYAKRKVQIGNMPSGSLPSHDHTTGAGDGGVLTNDKHDGYSDYGEILAPASPAADTARLYSKDSAGTTKMYYKRSDGTEIELAAAGASPLTVQEWDGAPSVSGVTTIKVGAGTLTDEGSNVVRLKSGAIERLRQDSSLGVTKDTGDYVSIWESQGEWPIALTQTTTAKYPLWVDNVVNTEPVIRFDGSTDSLSGPLAKPATCTLISVFAPRTTAARMMVSMSSTELDAIPWIAVGIQDASNVRYYINSGYNLINVAHPTSSYKLHSLTHDGATWELKVNDSSGTTYTGGQSGNSGRIFLGIGYGGNANVDIAELHFYDAKLSSATLATLTSSLMTKYGFSS